MLPKGSGLHLVLQTFIVRKTNGLALQQGCATTPDTEEWLCKQGRQQCLRLWHAPVPLQQCELPTDVLPHACAHLAMLQQLPSNVSETEPQVARLLLLTHRAGHFWHSAGSGHLRAPLLLCVAAGCGMLGDTAIARPSITHAAIPPSALVLLLCIFCEISGPKGRHMCCTRACPNTGPWDGLTEGWTVAASCQLNSSVAVITASASVGSIRKMSRKASDTFGTRATPTSLHTSQKHTHRECHTERLARTSRHHTQGVPSVCVHPCTCVCTQTLRATHTTGRAPVLSRQPHSLHLSVP